MCSYVSSSSRGALNWRGLSLWLLYYLSCLNVYNLDSFSYNSKSINELEGGKVIESWCQYGDLSFRVKLENNAVKSQTAGRHSRKMRIFYNAFDS